MSVKGSKIPDSDRSVRGGMTSEDEEIDPVTAESYDAPQTSNKTGKHSSVEKQAASRPEGGTGAGAKKVSGAFGKAGNTKVRTGTNPGAEPNKKTKHGHS